ALADQGRTTTEGAVRRKFLGPQGELATVRESWSGQESLAVCSGSGTDRARAQDEVHELQHAGARAVGGQAGSAVEQSDQETGQARWPHHRRDGLRATEPRRDGGTVHLAGRALRARECAADQQSAVLEVGGDLQGPDDYGGSD